MSNEHYRLIISPNETRYTFMYNLNEKEQQIYQKLQKYHILLRKQYHQLLTTKDEATILDHISLIREEEKKILNSMSPSLARKLFLETARQMKLPLSYCADTSLIGTSKYPFNRNNRMLIQLLHRLEQDDNTWIENIDISDYTISYLFTNYYPEHFNTSLLHPFRLDIAERFLGLVHEKETDIARYRQLTYGFFFTYPELLDEAMVKNRIINRQNSQLLANRFDSLINVSKKKYLAGYKQDLIAHPLYRSLTVLSRIDDEKWDKPNYQRKKDEYTLYLQTLLEMLSLEEIRGSVAEVYRFSDYIGKPFNNVHNNKASEHIYQTIEHVASEKIFKKIK